MDSALSWVTDLVMQHSGEPSPAVLSFLVRRYPDAPSPVLHAALSSTLTNALPAFDREHDPGAICRWLGAFADASVMVDDGVLSELVEERVSPTVDALEGAVRRSYEPGEGAVGESGEAQFALALALLVAFDLTARLPYAMLAEELLQTLRRERWRDAIGRFDVTVAANCCAAQVCCRLAALHRDPDYAARAVVAPDAPYAAMASMLLQGLHQDIHDHRDAAPEYGLAVLDAFALSTLPN